MNIDEIKRLCPEFTLCADEWSQGKNISAFLVLKALAEARQSLEWRPISEAPKDETTVDLWVVGTPFPDKPKHNTGFRLPDCWYCPDEQAWVTNDPFSEIEIINRPGINITHFRYLPTPPSGKEG